MEDERLWILWGKQKCGELEPEEADELLRLMEVLPASTLHNEMLEFVWKSSLDPYPPEELPLLSWNKIEQAIDPVEKPAKKRFFLQHRKWAIAASLIICAGLLYTRYQYRQDANNPAYPERMPNKVITQPDSKSQIELSDGTTVWLNKNSRLTYSNDFFGQKHREVALLGEAFFDVRKNESLPFIITTSDIRITVKGTAFNVKAYPESKRIETSLVRGLIEISTKKDPDRKILLKPNEKFILSLDQKNDGSGSRIMTQKDTAAFLSYEVTRLKTAPGMEPAETAWMNQQLYFNDNSFEELAPKLESWYNIKITFRNEQLKKVRFSGVVEKETIGELMHVLQLSSKFTYKISGDQLWLEL